MSGTAKVTARWWAAMLLALPVAACGDGGDKPIVGPALTATTVASASTTAAQATATTLGTSGETLDPKELLANVRSSIALVTTPIAQGNGVLLGGGYVVTRAHVVDPYGAATVAFEGAPAIADVPVVGIDPFADLMLLGPIESDRDPLTWAAESDLVQGDAVYLVGYPDRFEGDTPDLSISIGLVSRLRFYAPFAQTYVETDASFPGGASGGALFDSRGRLVALSGLEVEAEPTLAITGADVVSSIEKIAAGETPPHRPLVAEPAEASGVYDLRSEFEVGLLLLAAAAEPRTLRLSVPEDSDPTIGIADLLGDLYRVNQRLLDQALAEDPALTAEEAGELLPSTEPGVYTVEVPAGSDLTIELGTTRVSGAQVSFESNIPVVLYEDADNGRTIVKGQSVLGVIDAFEYTDMYLLDLAAGDAFTMRVSSAGGDPTLMVIPPGVSPGEVETIDDSGTGLYGFDVEHVVTAEVAGAYQVIVSMNDPWVAGYRVEVERA